VSENAEVTEAAETELAPERVRELANSGEAELIDVRRDHEFADGHLPGARQIEMNELTAQSESIPRERTIVFYCRSGNRSGMAAAAFREAGYDAHNMAGGIIGWAESGFALEPEGGHVAESRPPSAEETG
jgi:rhodanese-related sulfurtransferase